MYLTIYTYFRKPKCFNIFRLHSLKLLFISLLQKLFFYCYCFFKLFTVLNDITDV